MVLSKNNIHIIKGKHVILIKGFDKQIMYSIC
jgi:hypothetical protein